MDRVYAQTNNQNSVHLLQPLTRGETTVSGDQGGLNDYINNAFPIFLGVAIALAVVMISYGGVEYVISNIPGAKVEGKSRIKSALWGLVIALVAWIILNTINPAILSPFSSH